MDKNASPNSDKTPQMTPEPLSTTFSQYGHTEAQLRPEREELRRIVDLIPRTIIILNPDGKAIYANRDATAVLGLLV
jgi:PAS domain-containing protein